MEQETQGIGAEGLEGVALKRFVQVEPELAEFLPAFCDAFSYPSVREVQMKWFDAGYQLGVAITLDSGRRRGFRMYGQKRDHFCPTDIMKRTVEEIEDLLGMTNPCPKCGEPFTDLSVNMEARRVVYTPCGCVAEWKDGAKDAAKA